MKKAQRISQAIATLGITMMYGCERYDVYPSWASEPQEAFGGLMPRPRNDRNASPSTTFGKLEEHEDDHHAERVRQQVPEEDPVPARTDRVRGSHVVVLLERDDLASHHAGRREPRRRP